MESKSNRNIPETLECNIFNLEMQMPLHCVNDSRIYHLSVFNCYGFYLFHIHFHLYWATFLRTKIYVFYNTEKPSHCYWNYLRMKCKARATMILHVGPLVCTEIPLFIFLFFPYDLQKGIQPDWKQLLHIVRRAS